MSKPIPIIQPPRLLKSLDVIEICELLDIDDEIPPTPQLPPVEPSTSPILVSSPLPPSHQIPRPPNPTPVLLVDLTGEDEFPVFGPDTVVVGCDEVDDSGISELYKWKLTTGIWMNKREEGGTTQFPPLFPTVDPIVHYPAIQEDGSVVYTEI